MRLEKPYSVLYTALGQIFRFGPFLSYEEAMQNIRDAREDFDLHNQYVYILTPDHRLISVESDDL